MKQILIFMVLLNNVCIADGFFTAKIPLMNSCNGLICQYVNQMQISLLIMEPIKENLEFKSWTGYVPTFWANSDIGILYQVGPNIKIGGEVSYNHSFIPGYVSDYMAVRGTLEVKVW